MKARFAAVILAGFALSACSMKASHAFMSGGLIVATGGAVAPGEYRDLSAPTVSVGLALFAVGWVLHQSTDPSGGRASVQQVYTVLEPVESSATAGAESGEKLEIYRRLPADHALFTP